jgi:GntR family transcriptional regulator, negative regulator for fad regulon and positive regulator of fabA
LTTPIKNAKIFITGQTTYQMVISRIEENMIEWSPPKRPAVYAEKSLILAILNEDYPPGSILPSERELAGKLGITRPTLRETLQRLERDGWLTIQQGKSTRVNNYQKEGGLNVLNALVQYSENLPTNFIPNLLQVRLALAPAYTRQAVENSPAQVIEYLMDYSSLDDYPEDYASFDWHLHHTLTIASGNPIFTLILNGFAGFYENMACIYFKEINNRQASREFYKSLFEAVKIKDAIAAENITLSMMYKSIKLWESQSGERP